MPRSPENHRCHAIKCQNHCKPEHLMCARHWLMVPPAIRALVWAYYREGQCDDMKVSLPWIDAAKKAIASVAKQEHIDQTIVDAEMRSWDAFAEVISRQPEGGISHGGL